MSTLTWESLARAKAFLEPSKLDQMYYDALNRNRTRFNAILWKHFPPKDYAILDIKHQAIYVSPKDIEFMKQVEAMRSNLAYGMRVYSCDYLSDGASIMKS